jgi:hypothetical protein
MKRLSRSFIKLFAALSILLMAGCAGVPLLTIAKMATLNPQDVIMGDASQYMIAFDVSSAVKTKSEHVPSIMIESRPNVAGDFPIFERALAFEEVKAGVAIPNLKPASSGRKWIVYRLSPTGREGHADFLRYVESVKNRPNKLGGVSLNMAIPLDFLAEIMPRTNDDHVEALVQLKASSGFIKLWSGNANTLKRTG